MAQTPQIPQPPPISAEFLNKMQPAKAGDAATQSVTKLFRSSSGATRMDTGDHSVINNPATKQTILLDHVKKEVKVLPMPAPGQVPASGGKPPAMAVPAIPQAPKFNVRDLGKKLMAGHEVVGKQYIVHPVDVPKPPPMPQAEAPGAPKPPAVPSGLALPKAPVLPGMAGMPHVAGMPKLQVAGLQPPAPTTPPKPPPPPPPQQPPPGPTGTEIWHSPKLGIPMFSKTLGGFGHRTTQCTSAVPGEPAHTLFQIPAGYKHV